MIKILHTGDFHIGSNFSSFKNKEQATQILFNSINNMINTANNQNIDIILIAGDSFDSQVVNFSLKSKLISILSKFKGKIFVCCGNHDYYFSASVWKQLELPENIVIFTKNEFEKYDYSENIKIYGGSFTNIYENIELPQIDDDNINICLVHSDILTKSHYNSYSKEQIKQSGFDYVACGHNHKFSEILKAGDTYYAASGNISATGLDEPSAKGFIVGSIAENEKSFEFIRSNGLEIHDVEIDLSKILEKDDFFNTINSLKNQNSLCRFNFIGIDNMGINFNQLDFSDLFFDFEIENNSQNPDELWKYINDDSLLGEFTRVLRQKYDIEHDPDILTALNVGINALL